MIQNEKNYREKYIIKHLDPAYYKIIRWIRLVLISQVLITLLLSGEDSHPTCFSTPESAGLELMITQFFGKDGVPSNRFAEPWVP